MGFPLASQSTMSIKYIYFLMIFTVLQTAQAQQLCKPSSPQSIFLMSVSKHHGTYQWQMAKYGTVNADGDQVSKGFGKATAWQPAVVPGTVLTSLVQNKVYPDPYYGDINRRSSKKIPDMADSGREFYHYWYRTTFHIPATYTGKRVWIKFHGVNYKSNVWLNGKKLGDVNGMFNVKAFDITDIVNRIGDNTLAVNVEPVDVPGQSGPKKEKRNGAVGENSNGGDGEIGRNVTMLMSAGWDFTFPDGVRDRNTGIWRAVEVFATGNVILEHPFVYSKLPLPDTSSSQQTVSVEVYNASQNVQKGLLTGNITEAKVSFQKLVSLKPHERRIITFTANNYKQLLIHHPKLWWPVNKGRQNLYTLQLSFKSKKEVSSAQAVKFGIREITSDQLTPDSSRRFLVNGYPVFIRGTNWIPEAMLQNSVKRTHAELTYTRQAGINLLRLWGGGIAESDYFYELCDRMGFLVWTEYWLTGDCKFPDDSKLYLENLASTVKRLRNHASLAYHVSSNESTEVPGAAALIRELDPSRGYQMQSECCGVHDGSPYKYENPMQYFENTASKRGSRVYGFNPEYGTPCLPTVESLRQMMPAKDLWPINDKVWDYMDGGGFHQMTTKYREAVNEFGASASIEDYAKRAQLVGAMNYRSIWEVWNYNKFNYGDRWASGFLFWYHNSPVKQISARMYDWSLEPTAALYYSQNGLQPLHAQFDYLKNSVSVYNDYREAFNNYSLVAEVYDINAKKAVSKTLKINIPADGVLNDALKLNFPPDISQVHFIKIKLINAEGKEVANSFYWRSKDEYKGAWSMTGPAVSGFNQLNELKKVAVKTLVHTKAKGLLEVKVTNPSNGLAFFTQLKLQHPNGTSLSPAFYSDNFFNLLPGESKVVTIRFSPEDVAGNSVKLITDGYNKDESKVSILVLK
jgi:mannosylglycoprotein endo-beta-mannosidase